MQGAERTPVVIGVGQVADRTPNPKAAPDSVGLMAAALLEADRDAGGGWLAKLESMYVIDHVSFRSDRPSHLRLAEILGIAPRLLGKGLYPGGETPILLLNEAANRIGTGEASIAAVVGGEALRTESLLRARALGEGSRPPNALEEAARKRPETYRSRFGLSLPTNVYPLYENAGRAAYGQSLEEAQRESSEIWSLSSQVAAENPGAWIRQPRSAEEIRTPTPQNRPIAFPYSKLMVANSSVNMGAAYIVTSLEVARSAGVPEARMAYVGPGAAANEPDDFLEREGYGRSIGLETSINRTLELNGASSSELDWVELYSCFPTITKMARRVIDWPIKRPTTVYGGLTFGGGPIAVPMALSIVCMVQKIRTKEGSKGLIFGNGGFANHNHSIMLSGEQNDCSSFPQPFDYQAEADAQRGMVPQFVENHVGHGVIETYTVFYDRGGEITFGVIVGLTADRKTRFLAKVPGVDAATIRLLTEGKLEAVGTLGEASVAPSGDIVWQTQVGQV